MAIADRLVNALKSVFFGPMGVISFECRSVPELIQSQRQPDGMDSPIEWYPRPADLAQDSDQPFYEQVFSRSSFWFSPISRVICQEEVDNGHSVIIETRIRWFDWSIFLLPLSVPAAIVIVFVFSGTIANMPGGWSDLGKIAFVVLFVCTYFLFGYRNAQSVVRKQAESLEHLLRQTSVPRRTTSEG